MIAAENLRIGNKALVAGLTITIQQIRDNGVFAFFHADGEDSYYKFEEIDPMPITPELLEKCGATKDDFRYWLGEYLFSSIGNKLFWKGFPMEHIKYLHQLQNSVHSLTGEELTINL